MPTLVLRTAMRTALVDVRRAASDLAAAIPRRRLVIFEGAGHNYLVAAGPASTAAVLDFFAEVDGAPGGA